MYKRIIKYSSKHFGLFKKLAVAIICMQLSNLGSLNNLSQKLNFGYYPSVSTIARVVDSMELDDIRAIGLDIYKKARKSKMLSPYCTMWVGMVDGHEITTSSYCKCSHCKKRKLKTKDSSIKYQYKTPSYLF